MKKITLILILIFFLLCIFLNEQKSSSFKILKIISPKELYIDLNRNFILDEKEPYKLHNLYDISDFDEEVTENQKFLFSHFSSLLSKNILKNGFCRIKNNDLIINKKSYKNQLIQSGFFFDDTVQSKLNFKKSLDKIKPENFVIVNSKTKKYHELSCLFGRESKYLKIINRNELPYGIQPAKCCHNNEKLPDIQYKYNRIISNGNINVYFLDLNASMTPLNDCETDACKVLESQIDNARNSIDFAIYGFNNQPKIYKALENAKNRGVKIRWVTNFENNDDLYYPEINKLKLLLPKYRTNKTANTRYSLMHNKFFIFDDEKVYTGSANITSTDLSGFNANYSVLINSSDVAKIFKEEFEQMYNSKFGKMKQKHKKDIIVLDNNTKITILFSPQDLIIDNNILPLINNAQYYIYIPAFMITDKNLQSALIRAKQRGIDIKIINDATNAKSKYSVHKILRADKIDVKTENYAGKMHIKSIIIDDKYSVIGSMNFTKSGNTRNDENVLIIQNEKIAKQLKENFIHIWNKIPDKYLNYDPMAESTESIGSCFDGIDNDFDKKIDKEDEGCFIK